MGVYDYSLESELKGAEPRHVSLTKAALVMRLFLTTAFVVTIILTCLNAMRDLRHLRYLVSNCRPIQGEITSRYSSLNRHDTAYFLNYSYVAGGHRYNDIEKVNRAVYIANSPGSPITLAYLPQSPKVHFVGTISGASMQEGIDNWIIRGLIIIGFLGLFAVGNELGLRNQVHLLRFGKTARASVTSAWARRGNWGPSASSVSYRIDCHFWTGQEEIHKQFIVSGSLFDQVHAGDHVTVVFDRRSPENCLPYRSITSAFVTSQQ
jgi:hypothetical protein